MSNLLKVLLSEESEKWRQVRTTVDRDLPLSKEITAGSVLSGMRGVPTRVSYTSRVLPNGLFYNDLPIGELLHSHDVNIFPELVFLLFLRGKMPDDSLLNYLGNRLRVKKNQGMGLEVYDLIDRMAEAPPIDILIMSLIAMNAKSACNVVKTYSLGGDRWKPALDDAIDLLARMPRLIGAIAGARKGNGVQDVRFNYWPEGHLGDAFARYLNLKGPDAGKFMSLILGLHACHETGPASTNSALIASNAWASLYLALASGFCSLAGERHGGANDRALNQVESALLYCGNETSIIEKFYKKEYDGGTIFGFGHPVYEVIDPRYALIKEFLANRGVTSPLLDFVYLAETIVPQILKKKTKKCYPNIDLISGPALQAYGLTDYDMMPVLFAAGRCIGIIANVVVALIFKDSLDRPSTPFYNRETGEIK